MQNLILIVVTVFLTSCNNRAAETSASPIDTMSHSSVPPSTIDSNTQTITAKPDPIVNIREYVTAINTGALQKKRFEFVCDEKMMVDYFYSDGELAKISVDFGTVGDSYAKEEYYYQNDQLVFKYEFVEGGPACEGCITRHEYRSYIDNGKVIRYLKDQTEEKCRTCSFDANAKEYRVLKATTTEAVRQVFCR